MWIRQVLSGVPQLRDLSSWRFHGQVEGWDHPVLGYSIFGQGHSTLLGVCQFLSSVYQRLFQDHNTADSLDLQGKPFSWNPKAQVAFDILKMTFTSTPVLIHPDLAKPFTVETNALDFALGAILSQSGIDGLLWRAPKFLLRPKKSPTMLKSGSSWNLVPFPASSTKGGERGVLKAPGLD